MLTTYLPPLWILVIVRRCSTSQGHATLRDCGSCSGNFSCQVNGRWGTFDGWCDVFWGGIGDVYFFANEGAMEYVVVVPPLLWLLWWWNAVVITTIFCQAWHC